MWWHDKTTAVAAGQARPASGLANAFRFARIGAVLALAGFLAGCFQPRGDASVSRTLIGLGQHSFSQAAVDAAVEHRIVLTPKR